MNEKFNPERYKKWRQGIPWTDDEIATALEEAAASVERACPFLADRYRVYAKRTRAGFLSVKSLTTALDRLITACEVCGKTAHYRVGNKGRCRHHRFVANVHVEERRKRLEAKYADLERGRKEKDYRDLALLDSKRNAKSPCET